MLRFLIQSIPFNAELNSLQDGISDFTVAFTHHAAGVGSIIMRHPVRKKSIFSINKLSVKFFTKIKIASGWVWVQNFLVAMGRVGLGLGFKKNCWVGFGSNFSTHAHPGCRAPKSYLASWSVKQLNSFMVSKASALER